MAAFMPSRYSKKMLFTFSSAVVWVLDVYFFFNFSEVVGLLKPLLLFPIISTLQTSRLQVLLISLRLTRDGTVFIFSPFSEKQVHQQMCHFHFATETRHIKNGACILF